MGIELDVTQERSSQTYKKEGEISKILPILTAMHVLQENVGGGNLIVVREGARRSA